MLNRLPKRPDGLNDGAPFRSTVDPAGGSEGRATRLAAAREETQGTFA
jgi:hypothetical protein